MKVEWYDLKSEFPEVPNLPAKVEVEDAPAWLYDLKKKGVDVKDAARDLLADRPDMVVMVVKHLGLLSQNEAPAVKKLNMVDNKVPGSDPGFNG